MMAGMGERSQYKAVQSWKSHVGKVLRINKDGSFPKGNPHKDGVWSKGHRNIFGLTWDKVGGPQVGLYITYLSLVFKINCFERCPSTSIMKALELILGCLY
jgi:hypothetical protein